MPALGAVGTGVATAIVQWVMFAAMLLHVRRHRAYRPYRIVRRPGPPDRARLAEIGIADRVEADLSEAVKDSDFVVLCVPVGANGAVKVLKDKTSLKAGEIIDATLMRKRALVAFYAEQIARAVDGVKLVDNQLMIAAK